MESPEPLYYVWTEYALNVRPSELATLLDNPRVRTAATKTRCNLEVTRRVLNRRLYDQWTRYSILRITGPDDQSINQCNRMLERVIPVYQQRIEYSRRAPVTLYSKNVEAVGDFRSRVEKLASSIGNKRSSSEGRSLGSKKDRNVDSPFAQTGSFLLDTSAHVQIPHDDPASLRSVNSQIKLDAKFSTRSALTSPSHSEEQIGLPSPGEISDAISAAATSFLQTGNQATAKTALSLALSTKLADLSADKVAQGELTGSYSQALSFDDRAVGLAKMAVVHSTTSDVHPKDIAYFGSGGKSLPLKNVPSTISMASVADSTGWATLGLTQNVADNQEVSGVEADGLPARAVLTTQVSVESTVSQIQTDHPPSNKPTEVLPQNPSPIDASQPGSKQSTLNKAFSATEVTMCEQLPVPEPGVNAVDESRPCTATFKTEVSLDYSHGPDSRFIADVRISVQSRGPTEENVAVNPNGLLPLNNVTAIAVVNTEASTENVDKQSQNSVVDKDVATCHKEVVPNAEDNNLMSDQPGAIPSSHSGLNDVSTEQSYSRMIVSVTSGSTALRSSRNPGVPAEVLEATYTSSANSVPRLADTSQPAAVIAASPTISEKKLTLKTSGSVSGSHSTPENSADARLVFTEPSQLAQSDKVTKFETHTAVQLAISHLESEELIDIGETSIKGVEDLTKVSASLPKCQPALPPPAPTPLTNPVSPTFEGRKHPSPGMQPTSPVSVTTSISTNLEVHVNRETGQIDFSFEVNGTPVPSAYGGGFPSPYDPSFTAEWNFKLERNAAFGPVGIITSPSVSPQPPDVTAANVA